MKAFALVCAFGFAAAAAEALPPAQVLIRVEGGTLIQPLRIASVRRINGQVVRTSEWTDYRPGSNAQRGCTADYAFDCYEQISNCPNGPFYFGAGFINPDSVEDMTNSAGFQGAPVDEIKTALYWNPPGGVAPLMLAYFFYEQTLGVDGCTRAQVDNFTPTGDGILLNYGDVPTGNGFYYSRISGIIHNGIDLYLPADTSGSYEVFILTDTNSDGEPEIDPHLPTQPLLWGTGEDCGAPQRIGTQGPSSLDYGSTSCDDYSSGACPDPLGKMHGFLSCIPSDCTNSADFDNDGFITGADFDLFVAAFEAGEPAADHNGNGFIEGGDFDTFVSDFETGCR